MASLPSAEVDDGAVDSPFIYRDGKLYCEDISLLQLKAEVSSALDWSGPVLLYSRRMLLDNIRSYQRAVDVTGLQHCRIGYSLKANATPSLLRILATEGAFAVTVSANEIEFAIRSGFPAETLVFNGNGKQQQELELAVSRGCLVNLDADFDVLRLAEVTERLDRKVSVLIRLNPNVDTGMHPYNCTGAPQSKFGVELGAPLDRVLELLDRHRSRLQLVGVHCHIGSNVADPSLFVGAARLLLDQARQLHKRGFSDVKLINLGGGWGIDYLHESARHPPPRALLEAVAPLFADGKFTLLLEPGRSIVGPAGMLLTDVIGLKSNGGRKFIVVNAAVTEVIRPALYGAYHHITSIVVDTSSTKANPVENFDVVGPVCESGDFLAKDRALQRPEGGSLLAVWDVGAYCSATSSNYNLRGKAPEVLVDGSRWTLVRRPQRFDELWQIYNVDN